MMIGSSEGETLGRMSMMSGLPLQLNPVTSAISVEIPAGSGMLLQKKDDRVPQWNHQETKDFITIRAELEKDFTLTKRNKTLWEIVAAKMKERGYRRSPEQCKCKWKNLVNRYKGKETSDPENGRHCPFFEELQAVFTEREKSMQRLLLESESGGVQAKKKLKRLSGMPGERSSEEFSEEDEEDEEDSEDDRLVRSRKRKADRERQRVASDKSKANGGIQDILQEFLQHQQHAEMQWHEMMERRAHERRLYEQEWHQAMEKLERERLLMEQAWRERDEQRRLREESRAEKRDALLNTLLNRLMHNDL